MDRIPVAMNGWIICLIGFAGLVASVLASLLPTIKAAKIHPAEALRYE
jgi:ABC-type lipoprotein release transport system permease subunit